MYYIQFCHSVCLVERVNLTVVIHPKVQYTHPLKVSLTLMRSFAILPTQLHSFTILSGCMVDTGTDQFIAHK